MVTIKDISPEDSSFKNLEVLKGCEVRNIGHMLFWDNDEYAQMTCDVILKDGSVERIDFFEVKIQGKLTKGDFK